MGDRAADLETDYTRAELVDLCERAIVPEEFWHNRDSCHSHEGIGKAWAFLRAGVPYKVLTSGDCATDDQTVWVEFYPRDFNSFEEGDRHGRELIYLPTLARIDSADGKDWY